jgi:hypothetical protein
MKIKTTSAIFRKRLSEATETIGEKRFKSKNNNKLFSTGGYSVTKDSDGGYSMVNVFKKSDGWNADILSQYPDEDGFAKSEGYWVHDYVKNSRDLEALAKAINAAHYSKFKAALGKPIAESTDDFTKYQKLIDPIVKELGITANITKIDAKEVFIVIPAGKPRKSMHDVDRYKISARLAYALTGKSKYRIITNNEMTGSLKLAVEYYRDSLKSEGFAPDESERGQEKLEKDKTLEPIIAKWWKQVQAGAEEFKVEVWSAAEELIPDLIDAALPKLKDKENFKKLSDSLAHTVHSHYGDTSDRNLLHALKVELYWEKKKKTAPNGWHSSKTLNGTFLFKHSDGTTIEGVPPKGGDGTGNGQNPTVDQKEYELERFLSRMHGKLFVGRTFKTFSGQMADKPTVWTVKKSGVNEATNASVKAIGNDGKEITASVGDVVGFKSDVEQYSKVKAIRTSSSGHAEVQVVKTAGEYGRGPDWIRLSDCWKDDI